MTERKFRSSKVLPLLKSLPNTFILPIQQSSFRGSPDFVLCIKGRFVALELKRSAKYKPRKLQEYILNKVATSFGLALVVSPDNWNDIRGVLCQLAGEA